MLLIDSTHKCISKVKQDVVEDARIKGVHTLWVYELSKHPEGLTATELANITGIDRSLVSREIRSLEKSGYIVNVRTGNNRSYNSRIVLTEDGKRLGERFAAVGMKLQEAASKNISREEIASFYSTLEKICKNLEEISQDQSE
ncbi:MAG: MarR family transcriptional regulator [Clostridia bacterium]|nr:MarR family transcriptional regulator [Clostridia bacterium]